MIKQVEDKDFISLVELYTEYNLCLATKHNKSMSTSILIKELSQPGALAIGLYAREQLVGFTLGKYYSEGVYTFTAMYIKPAYRYHMKKLFTGSEALVKSAGYSAFISVSSTIEGINMHNKMGCNPIEIKFYKEL